MVVYQCEDSLEGIFTAIYNAYEDGHKTEDVYISLTQELMLFAEYITVVTDDVKAQKVINTLLKKFGREDYHRICLALSAPHEEKAQAVYRTVADGLTRKRRPGHLFDNLAYSYVHLAFSLARGAIGEYDHWRGFLRFEELEKGILYSEMEPKNHLMPFLMEHFVDRFPIENFMIYDRGRKLLGIHPAGGGQTSDSASGESVSSGGVSDESWGYASDDSSIFRDSEKVSDRSEEIFCKGTHAEKDAHAEKGAVCTDLQTLSLPAWFMVQCDCDPREEFSLFLSEKERTYQELFRHFCHKITVEERRNVNLQRNMMPLRFREFMTEFRT